MPSRRPPAKRESPHLGVEAANTGTRPPLNLVGIGASAGGIPALKAFFEAVPAECGIAFVVIMHLSPEFESHLAEVLQPHTKLRVTPVTERTRLEPDRVYVISPDRSMRLADGYLEVGPFENEGARRALIDTFFRTVAEAHPDGVGVQLSGSGTDGVVGLQAIKEGGGIILAQSLEEAEYETMPASAIATGLVDFVLPARELGAKVVELRSTRLPWLPRRLTEPLRPEEAEALSRILAQLQVRTGHDFSGYKKTTILRRIARRMQVHQTASLDGYFELLQSSPTESQDLMRDLLISVTRFFRDPEAFDALAETVVPALLAGRIESDPVRVWAAGCATGEEAYSIAILLCERAAGLDRDPSIQIFATDIDEHAVAYARQGLYPAAITADVAKERLNRFFRVEGECYRVRKEVRDMILFSPHDLLRDPPFSKLDLISSRNLLIYLEKDLQERVIDVFRDALRGEGFLFLGTSECVPMGSPGFRVCDTEYRIYQRTPVVRGAGRYVPRLPLAAGRWSGAVAPPGPAAARRAESDAVLHRHALESHAPPSILVDQDHILVHVSETANRYLEFPAGVPTADLMRIARPELRLELRTALFEALEKRQSMLSGPVTLPVDGEPRRVRLFVSPVEWDDEPRLALVVFLETTGEENDAVLESGTGGSSEKVEAELAAVRARLGGMIESADTRQEELGTSNEELQSINEEYKSTLEELETSKEELQSVNEELKAKVEQLARANDDLRNLMVATEIGTLFLDRDLRIQRFTPALKHLFNITPVDEGRPLAHVTHRLNYEGLPRDCKAVLTTREPVEREVDDGVGRSWLARIAPYRSEEEDRVDGVVATFTEITRVRQAREQVRRSEERFRALVAATAEIVWTADAGGQVVEDSPAWRSFTGQSRLEWLGGGWLDAVHPEDRPEFEQRWYQAVDSLEPLVTELRLRGGETAEWRVMAVHVVPIRGPDGGVREWVGMNTDITLRKEAEVALRRGKEEAERAAATRTRFLASVSHELRTPLTAVIGLADLLKAEIPGPVTDAQKRYLERIKAAAWHLVTIIDEVLTYSRTEVGRESAVMTTADLVPVVDEVVELFQGEATVKGIDLHVRRPVEAVVAATDVGKFRQILMNLLGNAIKFTERGSVELDVTASAEAVELRVRDTGTGISSDHIEEIFEPFAQVAASTTQIQDGVGLGLTVARRLARLLGGDIAVESTAGAGSTFHVHLPRDPPAQAAATAEADRTASK